MKFVADLEVHSKYARAVSPQMNVPTIAGWAAKKGIDLVGTGDFTHPMWLRELEGNLEEAGEGIYQLKVQNEKSKVKFLLTSEISCIYSHNGKGRRVHILVYLPTFTDVEKFNKELISKGANLFSDGRPIVGLTLSQIVETALGVQAKAIIIPAHVWTPWFGFYGSMSGYDHLEEAFGELAKYIPAVETGLSSDPAMNWKIGELTNRRIVSFSDAHSPAKLGREATVFDLSEISFSITQ
ncbi:MAG: and RNA helicase protein [Candidatus Woesebacteria bacterium GW2011_GWB1_40_101]|uniref:And RNA helicase protein n=1 Tax=Candidatus Woesebacteria bacterium GW2011_GWB1_40_101 TaxID=1618575 RepID=A0A0G0QCJ4_9BACT|nr:MAG: and RNA helicase protein [Candidatus Woesebacteria bacterium GW2011_GWB1_40_101]